MVVLRMSSHQPEPAERKECNVREGDRVQLGNHRATVKYVGAVPPTKGLWLGLDWDDPSRGKHDGQYAGTKYFQARYPTSGSLVRLEKVQVGQTICDAIKERYGGPGQMMSADQLEEIRRALNTPFLEMVGWERPADDRDTFRKLTVVGVAEYRVSSAGGTDELAHLCPIIRELDLSTNLISNWKVVSDIVKQLPYLRFLDLSENRLLYEDDTVDCCRASFKYLTVLILSKVEYTWEDIMYCARMWPQIEKLQVSYNNITNLSKPPADIFENLKLLNIEGNNIKYWTEVEKLGHLPRLECLNASNLGLTQILVTGTNLFPALKYILLSNNYINNWESISELNKLKALEELKFRQNPILEGLRRETARQIIIARLPSLKVLNLQEIEQEERRGAEIDYLKCYARDWIKTGKDAAGRSAFLAQHPIYPHLVNKYGEVDVSEVAEDKVMCLKSRLISVNLVYGNSKLTKNVPDTMLVSTLTSLALSRLLRDHPRSYQPNLVLVSAQEPNLRIPLSDSMKSLSYYSVADGDVILVE
uniref:Tubulin-specific chaperone E n=2 Tax=Triatoma infestans TaxID=30076 RepID=A0A023F7S1_TRIIF